jgi:hypothetical protein
VARNYRRVALAEEKLLAAKGIIEGVDVRVPNSAWYALGAVQGMVDDAIACLASNPSLASAQSYADALEHMEGYVQDALFGERYDGLE